MFVRLMINSNGRPSHNSVHHLFMALIIKLIRRGPPSLFFSFRLDRSLLKSI